MKKAVLVFVLISAVFGGYEILLLRHENERLSSEVAAAKSGLDQASTELERKERSERETREAAKKRRREQLKAEIAKLEELVRSLDQKLDQAGARPVDDVSAELAKEVEYEQSVVDSLAAQLQAYRDGIAAGAQSLRQLKTQQHQGRLSRERELRAQIKEQQDKMKSLRQRLRDRRALNLSVNEVMDADTQYKEAQARFDELQRAYADWRASAPADTAGAGQLQGGLAQAKTEQKQVAQALADERKYLGELKVELKKQDQKENSARSERDRLQNQYLSAKGRFDQLKEKLANDPEQ